MQIGQAYIYKRNENSKGVNVWVTSGVYSVNDRISNYWSFVKIKKDGRLGKVVRGDYNNANHKFSSIPFALKVTLLGEPK